MRRAKVFVVIGAVIWALCSSYESVASEEKVGKALEVANQWIALIDGQKYGESWETTAVYFKNAIGKEKWEQKLVAVREPLGKLVSRRLKSKTYTTSLPGAPDGEYVVIQFDTSFENKKVAVETVTPMLGKDDAWRVSGYYIK